MQELRGGQADARSSAGDERGFSIKCGSPASARLETSRRIAHSSTEKEWQVAGDACLFAGGFRVAHFVVAAVLHFIMVGYSEREHHRLSGKNVVVGVDQRDLHRMLAGGQPGYG